MHSYIVTKVSHYDRHGKQYTEFRGHVIEDKGYWITKDFQCRIEAETWCKSKQR